MPSFQDSVVIFFIALLIFGPKKLPELARQLGKLMGEFRRASNEFRMQMEDELRVSEQAEQQKKIAAMEVAAPVPSSVTGLAEDTIAPPLAADAVAVDALEVHPHALPPPEFPTLSIATSGDLTLMPPSTGLPVSSASVSQAFDSIPHGTDPETAPSFSSSINMPSEASTDRFAAQQIPDRTAQRTASPPTPETPAGSTTAIAAEAAAEASLHG